MGEWAKSRTPSASANKTRLFAAHCVPCALVNAQCKTGSPLGICESQSAKFSKKAGTLIIRCSPHAHTLPVVSAHIFFPSSILFSLSVFPFFLLLHCEWASHFAPAVAGLLCAFNSIWLKKDNMHLHIKCILILNALLFLRIDRIRGFEN